MFSVREKLWRRNLLLLRFRSLKEKRKKEEFGSNKSLPTEVKESKFFHFELESLSVSVCITLFVCLPLWHYLSFFFSLSLSFSSNSVSLSLFLKWANPGHFFVYFQYFQTNNTIVCEKCPSSILCRDLNPRPLERESLPTTTRPGFPPISLSQFDSLYLSQCLAPFFSLFLWMSLSLYFSFFLSSYLSIFIILSLFEMLIGTDSFGFFYFWLEHLKIYFTTIIGQEDSTFNRYTANFYYGAKFHCCPLPHIEEKI